MKTRWLLGVLAAVGCAPSPAPQYPPPAAPPQPMPEAAMQAEQTQPGTPPVEPAEETPIDPMGEMPEATFTTNGTLELGKMTTVNIDARSDIFSSGMKAADGGRGGQLPSALTLAPEGTVVTFPKVIGRAGCMADAAFVADGGDCAGGNTDLTSTPNIAGIVAHDRTLFLVGLFTAAKPPAKAPERLDFSADKLGVAFPQLSPKLGQVFFIGDGKTGSNRSGVIQKFVVPKGATMLYLGYADGFSFQGTPGAYGDNKGGLRVTVTQEKE